MSRYIGSPNFEHGRMSVTGILLVNLGTPDAPTPRALRRYLKQFLWDPRVVEISRPVWWLILNGIILNTRPRRSAHAYRQVWTEDGSPLLIHTRRQASALEASLKQRIGSPLQVAMGMRYGKPSIMAGLDMLRQHGCSRILVFPLYPQYAAATTASTFDAVFEVITTWRWVPELRTIAQYHDDQAYIGALASSVRELWQKDGEPEKLLFSFHGTPKESLLAGDPYHCQCQKTARLVAEALCLPPERWQVAFQSRFGRAEWLQPYTDVTLKEWGRDGVRSVDVICPGFSSDCLETIAEIGIENRDHFLRSGGRQYRYIPALNDRPDHIAMLADLALRHMQGWTVARESWDANAARTAATESARRAEELQQRKTSQ